MFDKILFYIFFIFYFLINLPEIVWLLIQREWLYFKVMIRELFD